MDNTKVCTKCKEEKPLTKFNKDRSKKTGYCPQCKECINQQRKQYRQDNVDKIRQYYQDNIDKIKKQRKQYYQDNINKIRQYRQDNADKIKKRKKRYNQDNADKIKKQTKQYRQGNADYKLFKDRLTVDEEPRIANDGISLEVRCKYCNKYFIPTNSSVSRRIMALDGKTQGDNYLYCSKGCKHSCPIYNQNKYPKDHKTATSREVQPQLRKMVLERDNWTCQECGKTEYLHCHHTDPVANNPIESADMDICITLCKDCHKEAHQAPGMTLAELRACWQN